MRSLDDLLKIVGENVLVTGASGGFGESIASAYLEKGKSVVAVGRSEERLEPLKKKGAQCCVLDLNNEEGIKDFSKKCPAFDVVILSHGVNGARPMRMINPSFSRNVIQINLLSTLDLLSNLLRAKKINSPGRVIFLSSISAHMGGINNVVYAASKAGGEAAMRGLARDLLHKDITVNSIAPAAIETPLFEGQKPAALNESNYPLGPGSINDVVNACLFLSLDGSKFITGESLILDGGSTWLD